jgi:hypothetical protein
LMRKSHSGAGARSAKVSLRNWFPITARRRGDGKPRWNGAAFQKIRQPRLPRLAVLIPQALFTPLQSLPSRIVQFHSGQLALHANELSPLAFAVFLEPVRVDEPCSFPWGHSQIAASNPSSSDMRFPVVDPGYGFTRQPNTDASRSRRPCLPEVTGKCNRRNFKRRKKEPLTNSCPRSCQSERLDCKPATS